MSGPANRHVDAAQNRAPGGEGRYRIAEAARRVGVSPSALRLWERQGLVRPARSRSRYRLYSDADVDQLRRVRRLREVERVNAPGIRRLLDGDGPVRAHPQRRDALRAARRARGLSLQQAADRSGLSTSFISAVERGASGASIAALHRLTAAYGTTLVELFAAAGPTTRLVRSDARRILEIGADNVRIEQLALGTTQLEPQLFVLAPGASSEGSYAHEGEEFLFVLDGAATIWLGDGERYALAAGDALSFPSSLPHRWRNDASGETRLLWINTPPTF